MKKLAILTAVICALALATAAGAATKKEPTPRQAYRAIRHCGERAGADSVKKQPGGGEMQFVSIVLKDGLNGHGWFDVVRTEIQWSYTLGGRGRVTGLLVVTRGAPPWSRVSKCLERKFGPATPLM